VVERKCGKVGDGGKKVCFWCIMWGNMENICTYCGPWEVDDDGEPEPDEVCGPVL